MNDYQKLQAMIENMAHEEGPFEVVHRSINGIEYPVYRYAPDSLRELLSNAREFGDRDFLVYRNERLSFNDFLNHAGVLSHYLVDELGVQKGDRVGIAMRNYPEWMIAFVAIISAGAVVVPLNAWWGEKELAYAIEDSGIQLIFADEQRLASLENALVNSKLNAVAVRTHGPLPAQVKAFESLCYGNGFNNWPAVPIAADDLLCLMYTSGSTGHPKGVATTNRAMVHALWYWLNLGAAELNLREAQTSPVDQLAILLCMPLFHATGCYGCFLLSLLVGRKVVMMDKWDAEEAMRLIEEERITHFNGAPAMAMDILAAPERPQYDLSSLTAFVCSGASTPPERVRQLAEALPQSLPSTAYGMTESCALGTAIFGEAFRDKPDCVGAPNAPIVQIRLLDEQGQEVAAGEEGEVCIKSVTNMTGYWNKPEATAQTLRDGWLHSGDLGRFDEEGCLHIVGRLKDIIIRGGENISCSEVEAAIYEHPNVLEACVYGIPDARLGEVVAVSLVCQEGTAFTLEELQAFLTPRLAAFKVPTLFDLRDESLPRIASGKIDRRQLRQETSMSGGHPSAPVSHSQ